MHDAWLQMLHGECDYTGAEMHAASARCDTSRRRLAAALLGRDPDTIAAAYADLEGRLVSARIAARAYEQARDALDHELRGMYRGADDRFFDQYPRRGWVPVKGDGAASRQRSRRSLQTLLTLGWLSQLVLACLRS